ncbi:MAG TPA: APC family permease [Pyrinomonadaceae bacterium]|nr:APC family permease [Pyrinomonadaceae bacterium]
MQNHSDRDVKTEAPRGRLLRVLGVGFGLAVIVGNTIGAGILRTPGEVAAYLPDVWLYLGVWVACGLYALLGAVSIAELATMMPRSGGQYVFARRALGPYAGLVVGWSDWLSTTGTAAAVSLVIGEYAGELVGPLAGRKVEVACAVVLFFALLQWRGVRWGGGAQNLTSLLKTLAFAALIVACFAAGGGGEFASATADATGASASEVPRGASLVSAFALALLAVSYTYDGWTGVIYFSEEVRDPARDIPRALFGGVLLIVVIYLLVNLAFLYVLPLSRVAGETLAAGAAAREVFGARGDTVIRALAAVSLLSSINAYHLMATRVLFAISRDRLFARAATRVNEGGTPTVALLLSTLMALVFVVYGESFVRVISALAFFFIVNYALSFISLFVLRRREPHAPRPYRAWGYPVTTALSLAGSVAILAGAIFSDLVSGTDGSLYAVFLLALSLPAFLLTRLVARGGEGEGDDNNSNSNDDDDNFNDGGGGDGAEAAGRPSGA